MTATLSSLSALAAMAAKTPPKAAKPTIQVNSDTLDRLAGLKHALDDIKTAIAAAEDQIETEAMPLFITQCRAAGEALSSVSLNGRATYILPCKYSKVPVPALADLRTAIGDKAGMYLNESFKIEMKADAAAEADVAYMMERLGAEWFASHFKVTQEVTPTPAMHAARLLDPAVDTMLKPFVESEVVKATKASIRF